MAQRLATAVLLLSVVASLGEAQTIEGTVRDSLTGIPVSGAVVMMLDSDRNVVARTVSARMGRFRLIRGTGTTLRVVRIGFHPYERRLGGSTSIDVLMRALGRSLRPVSVRSQPICPRRNDQREALALWSAATDALLAMVVAADEAADSGTVVQLLYNKVFSRYGRVPQSQSTRRVATLNVEPIRADRPPDEFVSEGYVVNAGEVTTWFGPDPEVLLDSSFAATHCLSMRQRSGEVGVAFSPSADRNRISDISGVLWMTRDPLALNSLTFEYRGLDEELLSIRPGGELIFETMTNGLPVIRSWSIRSPRVRYIQSRNMVSGRAVPGQLPVVAEIHETGGMIASGRLADGTVLTSVLASLGGRVLNGRTGEGVAGATVTVDSTDQEVVTDEHGQFAFETMLPGQYTVRVRDSVPIFAMRVDTTGNLVTDTTTTYQQLVTRVATQSAEAKVGEVTPRDIRLDWRGPLSGCGAGENVERRYIVFGNVVRADSQTVANARVRIAWADTTLTTSMETSISATSNEVGGFFICGVPRGVRLATQVHLPSGGSHEGYSEITPDPELERKTRRPMASLKLVIPRDRQE